VTCSKTFEIAVDPGVSWQDLSWSIFSQTDIGPGTPATFTPIGESNTWFAQATSVAVPATASTHGLRADGVLAYAGPNRNCNASMLIVNNDVGIVGLNNTLSFSYFLNGIIQGSVAMPIEFNGVLNFPFTAMAGSILLSFGINSNQFNASFGDISCSGTIENL